MKRIKDILYSYADIILVGLFMFTVFSYVMFIVADDSDLPAHARIAQRMLKERRLFDNNFLLFFCANLLSFFSGTLVLIKWALVFLISASNTIKYVLVKNEFAHYYSLRQSKLASISLLFVFVIPVFYFLKAFGVFMTTNNMYFHYYVPNVWHNSTILCMMPFAIISYILSVRQFEVFDNRRNVWITLSILVGTLIKPSFFFVYAIAYPICMLFKYRLGRDYFKSLLPILVGCLCVLYEYLTIFDGTDGANVVISFKPLFTFEFWASRIDYILVSIALPILFVVLYRKDIFKDYEFWLSLIMFVVAVGIGMCCQETGDRAGHGNFEWQIIAATWFVYYYMLKTALRHKKIPNRNSTQDSLKLGRSSVFLSVYSVHVLMGVLYLMKFMITKDMA